MEVIINTLLGKENAQGTNVLLIKKVMDYL